MQTYWPLTDWLKLWGDDTISVGFACFHFLSRDLEDTLVGWAVDAAMMTVHNLLLLLPLIRRVDEIPFVFWKPNGILMTVSWKPHAESDLKGRWTKECCTADDSICSPHLTFYRYLGIVYTALTKNSFVFVNFIKLSNAR